MKIYNNTNITYSAIEHNSRKNTKQNFPADLEKKIEHSIQIQYLFLKRGRRDLGIYLLSALWIIRTVLRGK